ncbi:MAG: RluA family pseudouridine synthase, partial [Lentisphaeria bacterium]|nr:RluA family pseudouridine synthase [Lentisphaeria bacterium]
MGSNPIGNAIATPSVMDSFLEKRIIRTSPGPEGRNLRLDCWLAARFTYRSRSEWQTAVRSGEILLNGAQTRPSRILHGDEIIDFQFPDQQEPPVRTDYRILADFPQYAVVDKPGNLPVHPAGRFFQHTLLILLQKKYGQMYPVNRLDRETSGTVLFARTPKAAARLAEALSDSKVSKKYLVYVHGCFPEGRTRASGWLAPDAGSPIRKKRRFTARKPNSPDCETCDTEFICLRQNRFYSKLECILHTGRLHQIRA